MWRIVDTISFFLNASLNPTTDNNRLRNMGRSAWDLPHIIDSVNIDWLPIDRIAHSGVVKVWDTEV